MRTRFAAYAQDHPSMTDLRTPMRWLMAAFYFVAGVGHLVASDKFALIAPDWVPWPREVVLVTGLCELAGAVALMTRRLRKLAGIMLALYAVCVFPANLKHAFSDVQIPGMPTTWLYHAPRLAFQPVLVWWALYCSGVTRWPWRRGGDL
jgi:uncharacterized membrane protein